MKYRGGLVAATIFLFSLSVHATSYYVDSRHGNDANPGTSRSRAWKSLESVNNAQFRPGDKIYLCSGSRWSGQLVLTSSGTAGTPIVVDRFGDGPLPRIDGEGKFEEALRLENAEHIAVSHLELTNHGDQRGIRRGVLIAAINFGTVHDVTVSDLYVHDVNGKNERDNGGIIYRCIGGKVPSRFDGLLIARNIVWKVDREGIMGPVQNNIHYLRSKWFPSLHVIIRDNYLEDIGGDGIVPTVVDGALVEHNIARRCSREEVKYKDDHTLDGFFYNGGIWTWSSDNARVILNEASFTHKTLDGEGFDSDWNSRNSQFFYNYSHDNDGGFMLVCTPVKRNSDNIGNTGTVIRHNISRNDHARLLNLAGADQTTVEDNAFYTPRDEDIQLLLVSYWDGWSNGTVLRNNIYNVAGKGRFGHEVSRDELLGTYDIAPGWGDAKDIQFEGNRYFGDIRDLPPDPKATIDPKYHPENLDWNEPVFDPAHPEKFAAFMDEHRKWMIRLFTAQFGEPPQLGE